MKDQNDPLLSEVDGVVNDVSDDEIRRVVALSGLSFDEQELKQFAQKFNSILGYIRRIAESSVDAPVSNDFDPEQAKSSGDSNRLFNVFRSDQIAPSLATEIALATATRQEQGCFVAPLAVDKG